MSDSIDKILNIIDDRFNKNLNNKQVNFIKTRVGQVIEYDSDTHKTYVVFPDDVTQQTHLYYNKTNEYLEEGDQVKVFYTTNVDRGWIGLRLGEPNITMGGSLEPITAITINSDTDYVVSTNAGIEKYIAVFEDG